MQKAAKGMNSQKQTKQINTERKNRGGKRSRKQIKWEEISKQRAKTKKIRAGIRNQSATFCIRAKT